MSYIINSLQNITNVGNITDNVITVTGINNFVSNNGLFLLYNAENNGQIVCLFSNGVSSSELTLSPIGFTIGSNNNSYLDANLNNDTTFRFMTGNSLDRITFADAQFPTDGVTLQQVTPVVEHPYSGGYQEFIADGTTTIVDILHNANIDNSNLSDPNRYRPYTFSLTTTEPIAINHLTRNITFPNPNTMRLTFGFAPNTGENANYVFVIYK